MDLVYIFPTLAEFAGLSLAKGLEGTSFVAVIERPNRRWEDAAFSQTQRGRVMGRSVRTNRYRYTEWAEAGKPPIARELYDHESPAGENANLASKPEYQRLTAEMSRRLHAGWQAALPQGASKTGANRRGSGRAFAKSRLAT